MITINNKDFAETDGEFTNSIFNKKGTCIGYAKRYKRKVKLFDMGKELIGIVTTYGVIAKANHMKDGSIFYGYGDVDEIGRMSCSETREALDAMSTGCSWKRTERCYSFK